MCESSPWCAHTPPHTNRLCLQQAVSDIVRTTLGPRSMLKMLLDPMGGIVLTNDGHAILREVDVAHPAAKSMIELSRAQDEEVGDGTTSVIVLGTSEALYLLRHRSTTCTLSFLLVVPRPFPSRSQQPDRHTGNNTHVTYSPNTSWRNAAEG